VEDYSAQAVLTDYAQLLKQGYCIPSRASDQHALDAREEAWLEALASQAAIDDIRLTHGWLEDRGGSWKLIATIAPPRHDRAYGLPRPLSNPRWRERFELDWGQRLHKARRRMATR